MRDLLKATSFRKDPKGKQTDEEILQRISVLSLNEKQFTEMTNLSLCPNLQTLHLFQNFFTRISSLDNLRKLKTLHLENNFICSTAGLGDLYALEKLFLNNNRIRRCEGLHSLANLQELQLANQKISGVFEFEEESLAAIGQSLQYLDCSNARVQSAQHFQHLQALAVLKMGRNLVEHFEVNSEGVLPERGNR